MAADWKARADGYAASLQKVSERCSQLELARVEAEERARDAEARLQRRVDMEAHKDRQLRDARLDLASALRDVEQLCQGMKPTDKGWRKEAGPEVEQQLAYLEKETTRWKKEALEVKRQLADERALTAKATRAWQQDWAADLAKHHFDISQHAEEVRSFVVSNLVNVPPIVYTQSSNLIFLAAAGGFFTQQ